MHKELNMQEHAVLQYACALQYISYCNDVRYKDKWVPVVKHFWAEVVKPFGIWTLHNLDPSHLLGTVMHLNWGAKIPDYGVCEHVAFICAAFFQGIESCSQYEKRRQRWEEYWWTEMAAGDHQTPSHGPSKRTWEWDEQGSKSMGHGSRSHSKSRSRQYKGVAEPEYKERWIPAPERQVFPWLIQPAGSKVAHTSLILMGEGGGKGWHTTN